MLPDYKMMRRIGAAKRPKSGNPGGNGQRRVIDLVCALDIETCRTPGTPYAHIYHWQIQFGTELDWEYGRTPETLVSTLDRLADEVPGGLCLRIYVHNLSYEWAWLWWWLRGRYTSDDVFCRSPRHPLFVRLYEGAIELRCSFELSHRSLGQWCKDMQVEHGKVDGYDHTKVRYPWTPLSDDEMEYCRNDVLGLVECLIAQLAEREDTLATIPLTQTGYVRRANKQVLRNYYRVYQELQPCPQLYYVEREAFRGGNCHANRFLAGMVLDNVYSYDIASSYPYALVHMPFPVRPFEEINKKTMDTLYTAIDRGLAVLARIVLRGLRLKDPYNPMPYITVSKCSTPGGGNVPLSSVTLDNGRVIYADQVQLSVTDLDLRIIHKHYTWESAHVFDAWWSTYGFLPTPFRLLVMDLYENKTTLKGVEEQRILYNISKEQINSMYGLQAQDPCPDLTIFDPESDQLYETHTPVVSEVLDELSHKRVYTAYQHGVWTTAWGRWRLQEAIDLAGDRIVYADTDSIYVVGDLNLDAINSDVIRLCRELGTVPSDRRGIDRPLGVWTPEHDGKPFRMITYGAKCYATESEDEGLMVTIAGVPKKQGTQQLRESGGLESLTPGYVFKTTEVSYHDTVDLTLRIDGHELRITPHMVLQPGTHTICDTASEYISILAAIAARRAAQRRQN